MDRRDFFKIVSATSTGVLAGCAKKTDKLIPLLVPEQNIAPGEESWHPAVCTECGGGCGTLVRVMQAERTLEIKGEQVRQRIAAVKKIEGNPLDPVSGGRLCARGQAVVQALYHPDRLRGPQKRSGGRGQGKFSAVSWDEALATAAEKIAAAQRTDPESIVFLTAGPAGMRALAIERFAQALKAPAPVVCDLGDPAVERKAAELVFGWKGLPVYDVANATYVLGVGADFLGGWASPVYYARQFGNFRQGRREIRGRLLQAESRLSLTASAADQWLPLKPGSEAQFLGAVGAVLLESKLARHPEALPEGIAADLQKLDVSALLVACGVEEKRFRRVIREFAESPAPLVVGGASAVHSNSLDAVAASHCINLMLGNVGKPGGVLPPATSAVAPLENRSLMQALARARVVLVDGGNPVYTLPGRAGVIQALEGADTVIHFGSFVDDTAAWADLLLPSNHTLEAEGAVVPTVSTQTAVAVGTPFVRPLYDTRPLERTLTDLAVKMNVAYQRVTAKDVVQPLLSGDLSYDDVARQGGVWVEGKPAPLKRAAAVKFEAAGAAFEGDAAQFPLLFQPYLSLQFHDGRSSNLPWMQELPDPASSAMWGLPVEIDPKTAGRLGISTGDAVRVESPHGAIEAPAFVHPGAVPGVVSMPIGDGHAQYGRYASGRGANPMSILAPAWEKSTGALITGATRVRLARVGRARNWIQFSAQVREERRFDHR
jgi:anaerobic selenocysteine-containing dehydrogenase